MLWIPMAIGAGVGLLKNQMEQGQANDERKRQAESTRYSPWTGIKGQSVKNPSLVGNVAQGAAAGAMFSGGGSAAAPAASGGTEAIGSGVTQNSLTGAATNSAPAMLGQSPEALQAAGEASKYSMGNFGAKLGSAGALNGGASNPGFWDMLQLQQQQNDPSKMYAMMQNMYSQNQ